MERQHQKKVDPLLQKKRYCHFCAHNVKEINYKDVELLRRYLSSYGKIAPRRRSGMCTNHQRHAARAIKQARIAGLLPFASR